jgi:hypothetical protein
MKDVNEKLFSNGILFSHFHLREDTRFPHGHAFWNYPSGRRRIEGQYTNGIRSGRWIEFEAEGSVRCVTELGEGEYSKPLIKPKIEDLTINPETTVLLEEEFGYRLWFWIPDRPMADLIEWWRGLFSVEPWFVNPEPLPGVLLEDTSFDHWYDLYKSRQFISGHINDDDDSELRFPSGEKIYHRARLLLVEEQGY